MRVQASRIFARHYKKTTNKEIKDSKGVFNSALLDFQDFPGNFYNIIEFRDIPDMEKGFQNFHDIPGFPGRVRTL